MSVSTCAPGCVWGGGGSRDILIRATLIKMLAVSHVFSIPHFKMIILVKAPALTKACSTPF